METLNQILELIATHSITLTVGLGTGLILEHVMSPVGKLRSLTARLLGKAKDAVEEE